MRRVSGPLLDRIDIRVVMARMDAEQLVERAAPEPSRVVAERVREAWDEAHARNGGVPNAQLQGRRLLDTCAMPAGARRTIREVAQGLELTARSVHRALRVARTIADLRGRARVGSDEILAAAAMRDRSIEQELAA